VSTVVTVFKIGNGPVLVTVVGIDAGSRQRRPRGCGHRCDAGLRPPSTEGRLSTLDCRVITITTRGEAGPLIVIAGRVASIVGLLPMAPVALRPSGCHLITCFSIFRT